MKELYNKKVLVAPKKKRKKKLKDVFELKGTHRMPDGTIMSGKTHSKNSRVVRKAPSSKSKRVGGNRGSKRRGY